MKIIDIDHKILGPRKAYANLDPKYATFIKGDRILPAPFFDDKKSMHIFVARHEPGTKGWREGGYETIGPGGEFRAYYFDQIMLHPEIIKKRYGKIIKDSGDSKGRGRPSTGAIVETEVKAVGKRGRPRVPDHLKKNKPYVNTGIRRGRKKKVVE